MKKTIIVMTALSALLLLGYGCKGKKEKKVDTPVEAPRVDDKGIAFEVFERIPKEELYEAFQTKTYTCPEDCRRHFGDSEGNDKDAGLYLENGGNHQFTLDCFFQNFSYFGYSCVFFFSHISEKDKKKIIFGFHIIIFLLFQIFHFFALNHF